MERQYCKRCSFCNERSIVLAPVAYSTLSVFEDREYTISIPELVVPRCSKCGRFAIDYEAGIQIDAAFRKQVGLLLPEEIRGQREALGMSQQQMAEQLHLDAAALEQWEAGFQIQPRSLDLLMRGFFKDPSFLKALAIDHAVAVPADPGRNDRVVVLHERPSSETPHEIAPG